MKRNNRLIPAFLLIAATILFVYVNRPSFEVIKSWKQSEHIAYHSDDPYFLNVVEDNLDFGHLPFSIPRRYFIYIGKESNVVTYGHIKDYSFAYNRDIKAYLDTCTVNWNADGVEFIEPAGHKFFIPKSMFTGGR